MHHLAVSPVSPFPRLRVDARNITFARKDGRGRAAREDSGPGKMNCQPFPAFGVGVGHEEPALARLGREVELVVKRREEPLGRVPQHRDEPELGTVGIHRVVRCEISQKMNFLTIDTQNEPCLAGT